MANARAAARTGSLTVSFNQPLTAASAGALKVFSAQRGGLRSRNTTPAVVSGTTLSFAPTPYAFQPGETVQYTVTTAAVGSAGLATPRVGQFTTAAGGTGVGIFPPVLGTSVGLGGSFDAKLGDVDNDGDLDILAVNARNPTTAGSVGVRLNDGTGAFPPSAGNQDVTIGISSFSLALGDLDGDGDLDFVATNNNSISMRRNNGSGTFVRGYEVSVAGFPMSCALGDLDGDGDLDLVVATSNNLVAVLLNDGTGSLSAAPSIQVTTGIGQSQYVALGDVDGDGDLDLLTALYYANTVAVHLNNGTGTFTGAGSVAVGNFPYKLAVGDLDGDGDLDFVTSNAVTPGTASLRLNDGTGTFGGGTDIAVSPHPQGIALGDIDADGDLDLLTASQSTDVVSIRLNDGNATFSSSRPDVLLGPTPRNVALGDLDGDGDLDFLTAHTNGTTNSTVLFGFNGGTAPAPAPTLLSVSPASGPVGTVVTLTGTNLAGTLTLNGQPVPGYTVNAAGTSLTFTVPANATAGLLSLTTSGGTATAPTSFCVQYAPTAPGMGRCGAGSVTLTASGGPTTGGTYRWYETASSTVPLSGTSGNSYVTPTLTATTTYYVAIRTGSGTSACEGSRTPVTATITTAIPTVTVAASGPLTLCPGTTVVLTATGATSYLWNTGATTASITVSQAGSYSVTGTNTPGGCAAVSAPVTVTMGTVPTATISGPQTLCPGGSVVLTASAGSSYLWNTGATTPTLTVTQVGTYIVTVSNGTCSATSAAVVIASSPAATATISAGGPTSFCQGASVGLTASGAVGSTYRWNTGATGASLTVNQAGSYTVTATTISGCVATSSPTVVVVNPVPPPPTVVQSGSGSSLLLTSSAGSGNQWYLNGTAIGGATSPTYAPTSAGTYTVVTTSAQGCASLASVGQAVVLATVPAALASRVQLYPNPTRGHVTLEVPATSPVVEVRLLNALGQVVSSQLVPRGKAELNLTNQAPGVYAVCVQLELGVVIKRLVIQ